MEMVLVRMVSIGSLVVQGCNTYLACWKMLFRVECDMGLLTKIGKFHTFDLIFCYAVVGFALLIACSL